MEKLRYGQWEPCESRGSSTVLREALGAIPGAYSPRTRCGGHDRSGFIELTKPTAESSATPIAGVGSKILSKPAENVSVWWKKARRVYPKATFRAWRFDLAAFLQFCKPRALFTGGAHDGGRVHRGVRRGGKEARNRAPVSRDDRLCASGCQDP